MNHLIPKDKHDIETAEELNRHSIEELRPIIPAIMEWMQDCNWPVSVPVRLFLEKHITEIQKEILDVLKTNDDIWKRNVLLYLGKGLINDPQLVSEIKKMATHPTEGERSEELDEVSREIIEEQGWYFAKT